MFLWLKLFLRKEACCVWSILKGKFRIAGKKKKITEKNGVLELKTRAGEEITLERIGL